MTNGRLLALGERMSRRVYDTLAVASWVTQPPFLCLYVPI